MRHRLVLFAFLAATLLPIATLAETGSTFAGFITGAEWRNLPASAKLTYVRATIETFQLCCQNGSNETLCSSGITAIANEDLHRVVGLLDSAFASEEYVSAQVVFAALLAPLVLNGGVTRGEFDSMLMKWSKQPADAPPPLRHSNEPAQRRDPNLALDYGEPGEMKGLTKLYIHTGSSADIRHLLAKHLKQRLASLQIVPADEAELLLDFAYERRGVWVGVLNVSSFSGPSPRLLQTYRHNEEDLNDLVTETTDLFLKEYRRVNGLR